MEDKYQTPINAETLSFVQLTNKEVTIAIPMIQRDYAQGRASAKATEIRENFVSDLYHKITSGAGLNLEFVYGSYKDNVFIPLDGQQRLTTLFLLHIYLDGLCSEQSTITFKFEYQTRDSSQRFCKQLTEHRADVFKQVSKEAPPSAIITNQCWWFSAWADDPTVSGMLNMLDEIHKKFFDNAQDACDVLFSNGKKGKGVTFQFLPLDNFYDPDDLYMKMNARGLPLTQFEIFKSCWIEEVEQQFPSENAKQIKAKTDVDWTDFLWPKRTAGMKNIDDYLQRLFKILIAVSAVAEQDNRQKKLADEHLDYLFEANKKVLTFSYNRYKSYGVEFDKSLLQRIVRGMDQLCPKDSKDSLFWKNIDDTEWLDIKTIWEDSIIKGENPTYKERLILHATVEFSAKFPQADKAEYSEWKRLIHNLLSSQAINNSSEMDRAVRSVEALLANLEDFTRQDNQTKPDINSWIATLLHFNNTFFYEYIWQEEVVKAELRKDSNWRNAITIAEKHEYLDGQIGIILHMAGLIPVYAPFTLPAPSPADLNKFLKCSELMLPLFTELGDAESKTVKDFLMVRAMLVKGDYMPWSSKWRKNFYNAPGDRDYSWKSLFAIRNKINDKVVNGEAVNCLRKILKDSRFDHKDIESSLRQIGEEKVPTSSPLWRRLLTSRHYRSVMEEAHKGFIAFHEGNENNVLIYGSSQRNGYHSELCSLYLHKVLRKQGYKSDYYYVIGCDNDYGLSIGDKTIYYWDGKWYTYNSNERTDIGGIKDLKKYIESVLTVK